jgi:hypothetical protein
MMELRVNLHRQLEAIEAKVIQLFALVAEDLRGVTQALLDDEDVLDVVIDRGARADPADGRHRLRDVADRRRFLV